MIDLALTRQDSARERARWADDNPAELAKMRQVAEHGG